jgi:RES domain
MYGGRWNAPGAFGALYLNADVDAARANARRFLQVIFGPNVLPEDIAEQSLPDVADFGVSETEFADALSRKGRRALRLAPHYAPGQGYPRCRAAGARVYCAGEAGIATTSAVDDDREELTIFDRAVPTLVRPGRRQRFVSWY